MDYSIKEPVVRHYDFIGESVRNEIEEFDSKTDAIKINAPIICIYHLKSWSFCKSGMHQFHSRSYGMDSICEWLRDELEDGWLDNYGDVVGLEDVSFSFKIKPVGG